MAISVTTIGINSNTSGATVAITVPAGGVPSGALICIATMERSGVGPNAGSVADTATNSYSAVTGVNCNNTASSGYVRLYYVKNCSALVSGNTITYTKGSTGTRAAISAFYATGIDTTAPLDTGVTTTAFGNSTSPSVTSGAPATAGSLFVAALGSMGNSGTFTQDGAFATPFDEANTNAQSTGARVNGGNVVNAGSLAKTYAPSISGGGSWGVLIAAFKPASGNKSLAADSGSYSLSGTAATPKLGRRTTAGAGSYALTGTAATLHKGYIAAAGVGSYVLTGTAATLKHAWKPTAGAGSYSLTGTAATLRHAWVVSAGAGSYSLSGVAASLLHAAKIAAGAGSYALTGTDAALTQSGGLNNYTLAAGAGSYALSGTAASPFHGWKVAAGPGSYALSGIDASFVVTRLVVADSGSYALSGSDAGLVHVANDNDARRERGDINPRQRRRERSRARNEAYILRHGKLVSEPVAPKESQRHRITPAVAAKALAGLPAWLAGTPATDVPKVVYVPPSQAQVSSTALERQMTMAITAWLVSEAQRRADEDDEEDVLLLLAAS